MNRRAFLATVAGAAVSPALPSPPAVPPVPKAGGIIAYDVIMQAARLMGLVCPDRPKLTEEEVDVFLAHLQRLLPWRQWVGQPEHLSGRSEDWLAYELAARVSPTFGWDCKKCGAAIDYSLNGVLQQRCYACSTGARFMNGAFLELNVRVAG
jgi:hypothetical protein